MRELGTPQQFLEFHRKIYAGRGIIDGDRALAVAQAMGFDRQKIIDAANAQRVTETMTAHAKLGTALKLMATPAYVIAGRRDPRPSRAGAAAEGRRLGAHAAKRWCC